MGQTAHAERLRAYETRITQVALAALVTPTVQVVVLRVVEMLDQIADVPRVARVLERQRAQRVVGDREVDEGRVEVVVGLEQVVAVAAVRPDQRCGRLST
jgi:hypothetical protein